MHSFFIFDKTDVLNRFIFLLFIIYFFQSCDNKKSIDYTSPIFESNYLKLPDKKKIRYLDSIEKNIDLVTIDSIKTKILFEVAAEYYYLNRDNSSFRISKKIFEIAKKNKDSVSMGRSLYYMGDCYEDFKKDSAYYFYKESEKIFRLIKNDERLAKALFNKAHLLFTEGNYIESEIEVIKALQRIKNSNNYEIIYSCYYLQASNHTELEELEKADEYLNLALKNLENANLDFKEKDNYLVYKTLIIVAKCNIYDKKEEFYKSIEELEKIDLKLLVEKNYDIYSTVTGNLAFDYMKIGNYSKSLDYYKKSLSVINKKKVDKNYLFKIINLGEFYLLKKDTTKANSFFNKALHLSKELKSGREILKVLNFLSISDKTNASNYKTEYIRINDSIIKKQRENREKFARIEYETEKVEEANKVLSLKNLLLLLGLTLTIVVSLIVLIIRNRIARKKELYLVQQKERANEELSIITKEFQLGLLKTKEQEQDRISKELHDGIVNQIYGIRMILGSLNRNTDEESQKKRSEYLKELHKLETEIRALSHDLNSDFSKYVGEFKFLLEQLIQKNNEIGNTIFDLDISSTIDWNTYSPLIKINIYRILQELLQNVNKYAEAKNCFIKITKLKNNLIVEVKDDGKGFDVKNLSTGIGINNIKERAKTINADLIIESDNSEGSRFHITIKI